MDAMESEYVTSVSGGNVCREPVNYQVILLQGINQHLSQIDGGLVVEPCEGNFNRDGIGGRDRGRRLNWLEGMWPSPRNVAPGTSAPPQPGIDRFQQSHRHQTSVAQRHPATRTPERRNSRWAKLPPPPWGQRASVGDRARARGERTSTTRPVLSLELRSSRKGRRELPGW